MPICKQCNCNFPKYAILDGKWRDLRSRSYCPQCSPLGTRPHRYKRENGEKGCLDYTKEELQAFATIATSIDNMLIKMGHNPGGRAHATLKQVLAQLGISTSHFTGQGWSKGLTAKQHPSIASSKLKLTGRPHKGTPHTAATKFKLSLLMTQYLETHSNHGLLWYAVPCGDRVIKVQGTWEKKVAEWLNANNIRWDRIKIVYQGHHRYTPDFYLPDYDFFIEVKGFWRETDIYKMFLVLDDHPNIDIRYVDKTNIKQLTLELPKFLDRWVHENINFELVDKMWASTTEYKNYITGNGAVLNVAKA